ncbi:hypothetical protein E2562_002833 [Oryza meyeriana var. granulata]|uniref:Uncharacterized protein n=1 Tax=Oryza meyeriana var. granulata TaxID=110450 RepID=A0A6G1BRW8_9ORYZ|nr:hypothetical protein E2562_002833 [Oryza meyeriana var. granulata]
MSRTRTTAANLLAVALLIISLLMLLHLPVACARHVAVLKADSSSGMNIRLGDVGIAKEPTSANGVVQRPASSGRRPTAASRTVEMRTSTSTKHHRDEAAKMYDMLRRDYAWKARRRSPINNGEPLQEEQP